jgi:SAM-dependent methyltransferase
VQSLASSASHGYVFDNSSGHAACRFHALEAVFDPGTRRLIGELGVGLGWSCLEVGAGNGSIARWLADQIGAGGRVVATDIDPRYFTAQGRPNLILQRHDISRDPLPLSEFDLVHARLVLIHLPERRSVLQRLAAALKPGGWLLVEEFDSLSVRADPMLDRSEAEIPSLRALQHVVAQRGVDLRCGRLLGGWLDQAGLQNVCSEGRIFKWRGGTPGADLMRANIAQLRAEILAAGAVSEAQLEHDLARLERPHILFPSPILWSAWGQRRESTMRSADDGA